MTTYAPPDPPDGLGERGRALWGDLTAEFELRPDELIVLGLACAEVDLVARLQSAVDGLEDLRVRGSVGQWVAAPEVAELRQHSLAVASLLARLKLPDEDAAPAAVAGHPMSRSQSGQLGARARWGNGPPTRRAGVGG